MEVGRSFLSEVGVEVLRTVARLWSGCLDVFVGFIPASWSPPS